MKRSPRLRRGHDRADSKATPDPCLRDFLRQQGILKAGDDASWTPLPGGVSSDIWRVDLPGRSMCIKRALPQLKVAQPWYAPIERNAYEWAWINFVAGICPDAVPEPIASDLEQGIFAMSYLDPKRYPVWKGVLLDGVAQTQTAAQVGAIIGSVHAASAADADIAQRFGTDVIFHAIRLEPYLLATALRHPDLAHELRGLAERTAQTRRALVHGDVSPKNILLGPKGPVFLDAECAWYGDPAFDAAFCLNHFLLKCVARPQSADAFLGCYAAFAEAYLAGVTWEAPAEIERRIASLLPGLFLARIDGKSPVEYIIEERDKRRVRETARALIAKPPSRLAEVAETWRGALALAQRA
jgi:aminoglycoside phosphotransferase (APT) family kinase protein